MKQKQLTKLIMNFGISALFILLSGLMVIYGIIPGVSAVKKYYMDNQQLMNDNDLIRKKITFLSGLDEDSLTSQMQTLLSAIPENKSFETALSTIQEVAADAGVIINDLELQNPGSITSSSSDTNNVDAAKLGSNIITMTFSVGGGIDQTNAFLAKISAVRRLMRVDTISLSLKGDASGSAIVDTNLNVDAFYSALPKTLGKAEDQLTPLSENDLAVLTKISAFPLMTPVSQGNPTQEIIQSNRSNPFSP